MSPRCPCSYKRQQKKLFFFFEVVFVLADEIIQAVLVSDPTWSPVQRRLAITPCRSDMQVIVSNVSVENLIVGSSYRSV